MANTKQNKFIFIPQSFFRECKTKFIAIHETAFLSTRNLECVFLKHMDEIPILQSSPLHELVVSIINSFLTIILYRASCGELIQKRALFHWYSTESINKFKLSFHFLSYTVPFKPLPMCIWFIGIFWDLICNFFFILRWILLIGSLLNWLQVTLISISDYV